MKRIKAYSPILILGLSQWSKYVSRMPVMKSLKKPIGPLNYSTATYSNKKG